MAARTNKVQHDEKTKQKIRASQLLNFLASAALRAKKGKPVDPVRVAAAKAALPFLMPTLASVEQTIVDDRDKADAGQLAARLAALFNEKPGLFEQVMALKNDANAQQQAQEQQPAQVTH